MKMADYIRDDLAACIHSGRELPAKLTLDSLSQHYGVSFTPVRVALNALVKQRLVRKKANGRLEVQPNGRRAPNSAKHTAPAAPRNWEKDLAAEVLRCSLQGEAVYLREEAMAAKHGKSRTVVRQAFGRLVAAGLLEHVPRHGWRVRLFREEELKAYLEIRETLELKALELARPRLLRADLEKMLAGNVPGPNGNSARLDNDLHRYLIEKSRNRFIQEFFERHGAYFTTLFDYAALGAAVVSEMAAQHRRVLQPLIARNWPQAQRALSHHIRSQRPVLKKMMERLAALPLNKWPGMKLP